jgi:hypothetical protein
MIAKVHRVSAARQRGRERSATAARSAVVLVAMVVALPLA